MKDIENFEYYLKPGYLYLTREDEIIYTVLGSCVMVTLWDKRNKYAAVCHYLYPYIEDKKLYTSKYGNVAIRAIIKYLLENGSKKYNLEAMIFGGGDIYKNGVGQNNILIARKILKENKIKIISEDTGGSMGRKIIYHTRTNQAIVYKVKNIRKNDWWPYGER